MPVSLTIKYDDSRPHNSVEVAGEFSGWRPVGLKLERPQDTSYAIEVPDLELGKKYMYKFIIDGEWILASDGRESQDDGHGNLNHVLVASRDSFVKAARTGSAGTSGVNTQQANNTTLTPCTSSQPLLKQGEPTYGTVAAAPPRPKKKWSVRGFFAGVSTFFKRLFCIKDGSRTD